MVACRTASAEGTLAVAVDVDLPDERAGDEDAMMSPVRWKPSSSKTAAPLDDPASVLPTVPRTVGRDERQAQVRSGQLIVHCCLVWPFRPAQRFEAAPTRATPLVPGVPWTRSRRCRARCCRRPPRSARCRGLGLVRQCGHSPVGRGRTCRREGDHERVLTVDPDGRLTTPIWLVLTATGSAVRDADGAWSARAVRPARARPRARTRAVTRLARPSAETSDTGVPSVVSTRPGRSRPASRWWWRRGRYAGRSWSGVCSAWGCCTSGRRSSSRPRGPPCGRRWRRRRRSTCRR
ncbi:hypothetical protein QF027_000519 [Streptomyces canus]|nr:hypothetical protein [Streptomyces canus]